METMTDEPPQDLPPMEEQPEQHEVAPRKPVVRRQQRSPAAAVEREIEMNEAMDVRDLLLELGGETPFKISISRSAPRIGPNGENVLGLLETVEEAIDDQYIRETWGGGVFRIMIQTLRPDGRYKIHRRIQLKLAGEPKMHGRSLDVGAPAPTGPVRDTLAERAFDTMARREQDMQQQLMREREGRRDAGFDPQMVSTFTTPVMEQLREANATIRELQLQIVAQANRPAPSDPFRDQLMTKMLDSEKQAVDTLRAQYENRMEAQRERLEARYDRLVDEHAKAVERLEDRHADAIKSLEQRHHRELLFAEKQTEGTNKNTSIAYDARLDAQRETITRLERELTAAAAKLATLEAKKDQTIADKANELLSVQEALEGLGAGGAGEKDEKWWSKALDVLGNSQAAMAVVDKLTGGAPPPEGHPQVVQQQAQQQQLPPPGVPWQAPDGNVYVRDGEGNVHQLDPHAVAKARSRLKKKKRKAARAAAATANGVPEEGLEAAAGADDGLDDLEDEVNEAAAPVGRPPDASEIAIAINFMENAIKGNAPAESFGATARNLMPADVLAYIMQFETIDLFLNQVKLAPGSPLTTVGGRRFARAVHKYLREGSAS